MSAEATARNGDPLWRFRWFMLASCLCTAAAVAILVATSATTWNWPLLVWGVLIGIAGLAAIEGAAAAAFRRDATPERVRAMRPYRRVIYDGSWLFFGSLVGVIAAAFGAPWVDAVLTAYLVLSVIFGFVVYRWARRKQRTTG